MKKNKPVFRQILERLDGQKYQTEANLLTTHPLLADFLRKKSLNVQALREKSAKLLSLAALSAGVFLSPPTDSLTLPIPKEIIDKLKSQKSSAPDGASQSLLLEALADLLPPHPRPLTGAEEQYLENLVAAFTDLPVKTRLDGQHLNTIYGTIGAEQHLHRYPTDSLNLHGDSSVQASGLAPGKGAWGYFAPSAEALSQELAETEKWYAVVQTMYLPDWNTDTQRLRDWYKYRKILILNTQNGQAVVSRIADAGPAAWTGKQFGGSPEVMRELGGLRYKKGPVLVLFVDDPENKIPLGPINYQSASQF